MTNLPVLPQRAHISRGNNLTPTRRTQWLSYKNRHAPDVTKVEFQVHKWRDQQSRHQYTKKLIQLQSRIKNSRSTIPGTVSFVARYKKSNLPLGIAPPSGQLLPPLRFLGNSVNLKQFTATLSQNEYIDKKESLFYSKERRRKIENHVPSPISRIRRSLLFHYDQHVGNVLENTKEEEEEFIQSPPKTILNYSIIENSTINEETVTIISSAERISSPTKKPYTNSHDGTKEKKPGRVKPNSYPELPEFTKASNMKSPIMSKKSSPALRKLKHVQVTCTPDVLKAFTPGNYTLFAIRLFISVFSSELEKYSKLPPINRTPVLQMRSPSIGKLSSSITGSHHHTTASNLIFIGIIRHRLKTCILRHQEI